MISQETDIENILAKVEAALDTMRPYLKADGGDIEVVEIKNESTLYVKLLGSCVTCPMSYQTMKAGVEDAVVKSVPQIKEVIAINISTPDTAN